MVYAEASIGIFGKVAKLSCYLHIYFVGVYFLWKRERQGRKTPYLTL